jgi:dihydropteroate synthase
MQKIDRTMRTRINKVGTAGIYLPFEKRPLIMGILNVTPDSFSDGGQYYDRDKAIEHGLAMVEQGADIIDIGGESTRPGAAEVTVEEEIGRVIPIIEKIKASSGVPISIDTRKAEVAESACSAGAVIINDISALRHDAKIAEVAARHGTYLILMHMRGTPATMQTLLDYNDLVGEISAFLDAAANVAQAAGVARSRIIIDPGIGFAKTVEHNFRIIKNIPEFKRLGYPVMIGASRKSFIGKTLNLPADERLEGSLAAAVSAFIYGADIIRAHDVLQTVRALKIAARIKEAGQ